MGSVDREFLLTSFADSGDGGEKGPREPTLEEISWYERQIVPRIEPVVPDGDQDQGPPISIDDLEGLLDILDEEGEVADDPQPGPVYH